jgi:hypothetical protein
MPPSPWIDLQHHGDDILVVLGHHADRLDVVVRHADETGTSGSKPACALRLPVADSVAMVRPWKAFSMTMMCGSFDALFVAVDSARA